MLPIVASFIHTYTQFHQYYTVSSIGSKFHKVKTETKDKHSISEITRISIFLGSTHLTTIAACWTVVSMEHKTTVGLIRNFKESSASLRVMNKQKWCINSYYSTNISYFQVKHGAMLSTSKQNRTHWYTHRQVFSTNELLIEFKE